MTRRLGVGFVGSGFITQFHIRSWQAVRDADVLGVWSPNRSNAEATAGLARSLRVGEAKAFGSIEAMAAAPEIDAIWSVSAPSEIRRRKSRCQALAPDVESLVRSERFQATPGQQRSRWSLSQRLPRRRPVTPPPALQPRPTGPT